MAKYPGVSESDTHLQLLCYLFHECFVPTLEAIPASGKIGIPLPAFVMWATEYTDYRTGEEECTEVGVPLDAWDRVKDMIKHPDVLSQIWFAIVVADRPAVKHTLKQMSNVTILRWDDGTVLPFVSAVTKEMIVADRPDAAGFTDGLLMNMVAFATDVVMQSLANRGLDSLHDEVKVTLDTPGERDPVDLIVGTIMRVAEADVTPAKLRVSLLQYAHLIATIFRPQVPLNVAAAHAASSAKKTGGTILPERGTATGGWSM